MTGRMPHQILGQYKKITYIITSWFPPQKGVKPSVKPTEKLRFWQTLHVRMFSIYKKHPRPEIIVYFGINIRVKVCIFETFFPKILEDKSGHPFRWLMVKSLPFVEMPPTRVSSSILGFGTSFCNQNVWWWNFKDFVFLHRFCGENGSGFTNHRLERFGAIGVSKIPNHHTWMSQEVSKWLVSGL